MNSPKTLIIISVIVVAIAFAAGYGFRERRGGVDNSPSPTPTATLSAAPTASLAPARKPVGHTVHLTASGPVPKTLTIVAGDLVTFVGATQSEYWPVSQACPDLNARRGLKSGDTYALSLSAVGTCDYYNHLDPYNSAQKGSFIVQ